MTELVNTYKKKAMSILRHDPCDLSRNEAWNLAKSARALAYQIRRDMENFTGEDLTELKQLYADLTEVACG